MIREDITTFGPRLLALADVFDAKLSASKIASYFEALIDLDLSDVFAALHEATRTCKFFPRPVELRTLVLGEDDDAAEHAWMALRKAMTQVGGYASIVMADPALAETVISVFQSWPAACTVELSPEMWTATRKAFGRVYRVCRHRQLAGVRYLPGMCEQQNAGRPDWMRYVPVQRLEGGTVQSLSLPEAEEARTQIAAQQGFQRLGEGVSVALAAVRVPS